MSKRVETCKRVGGQVKQRGHDVEKHFNLQFNPENVNKIEYGACADAQIKSDHDVMKNLIRIFDESVSSDVNVSIKSSLNIQITLGRIPELEQENVMKWLENKSNVRKLMNKYFKKANSSSPVDLLCYYDKTDWIFFNMDHVVDFITTQCEWRTLGSGRMKGDFKDDSNKGKRQYLTYEYRKTHNSYFLGFNGNKGGEFIQLLRDNIDYVKEPVIQSRTIEIPLKSSQTESQVINEGKIGVVNKSTLLSNLNIDKKKLEDSKGRKGYLKVELEKFCETLGLSKYGNKDVLVIRIMSKIRRTLSD